ncbi:uncharacterized protein N7511_009300 [Penicillium nucicola]|uniref:uncharacterized protein n=1 Tax=Penicillium nucicola TaxID=1850975 RepID=UPI0025452147|nr:uncharacterized protein N7511_009300 [Penicillium nucicola]KAJ5747604.1 hypothetical protein N7511_009300 [Penicillium nucicola]
MSDFLVTEAIPEANDPVRRALIRRLAWVTEKDHVRSTTYALLWLADLSQLEGLINAASSSLFEVQEILSTYKGILLRDRIQDWATAPCPWNKGKTEDELFKLGWWKPPGWRLSCPEPPTPHGLTRTNYIACGPAERRAPHVGGLPAEVILKRTIEYNCLDRDGEQCILTKCSEPIELACIYAGSLGEGKAPGNSHEDEPEVGSQFEFYTYCWRWIGIFWNHERVSGWQDAVDHQSSFCTPCESMITLSSNAHALWRMARFALKPIAISEDRMTMTLQFFWLPVVCKPRLKLIDPPVFPSVLYGAQSRSRLWNYETNMEIRSRDIITITTKNPEENPLPSMELVELQWFLTRVLALSGAAEFPMDDDSNSSLSESEDGQPQESNEENEEEPEIDQGTPSDVVRARIEEDPIWTMPGEPDWTSSEHETLSPSSEEERGRKRVRHS